MTKHTFHRFINFGPIGDRSSRNRLIRSIYEGLQGQSEVSLSLSNKDTDNFGTALGQILDNQDLREFCVQNEEFTEQITREILDFINKVKRKLSVIESPFDMEQRLLEEFEQLVPDAFEDLWEGVSPFIQETYPRDDLDPAFYTQAFRKSLVFQKRKSRKKISFEGVKAHFTEKWKTLLDQKRDDWEEEYIAEQGRGFKERLDRRLEAMQAMKAFFNPYPGEPMRLWNLTKTPVQRSIFDALNKYAELLRRDPFIQELADALGRSSRDEAVFEEVPLEDQEAEPERLRPYAGKAELIGIHESGDLSSMTPSEMVLLAEETAQILFYKKFAEKKLQTFAYQHKACFFPEAGTRCAGWRRKETSKGPFILCIDTSGSMRGTAETIAKTLCFGLLKIAFRDKRACYLISFGVDIETLNLTDLTESMDTLTAFLSQSFYGGTDPMPALQEALNILETAAYRRADLVVVSDFIMPPLDEQTLRRIKAAKENKTQFHSILTGDPDALGLNKTVLDHFDANWVYTIEA
ncbi:MAG: VWA domain-containing protein [Treponema sp.]|jgi:uncharacterized protein with von Willebrand factor type A (vWA) domain|nr:VWA domain-containing protein [Treponema sp.]